MTRTEKDRRGAGAEEDAYWQGPRFAPDPRQAGLAGAGERLPRYGSVSARARRLYASEDLRYKDRTTAALLAFFLGMFGIHKFYLGCNQAGFVMMAFSIIGGLMTFGLAAAVIEVIAVIEGLLYLTKTQTRFEHVYVVSQRDWF